MAACSLLLADDLKSGSVVVVVPAESGPPVDASDPSPAHDVGPDAPNVDERLLGWWPFAEIDGSTTPDVSGHGHVATLTGDAVITPDGPHGGRSVRVSGAGTVAVASLAGAAFPRTGTLSFWFRYETMTAAAHVGIFDIWDTKRKHLYFRHANDSPADAFQFALQQEGSGVAYAFAANPKIARATWTHIALVWDTDAARASCFVDGALVGEGTYGSAFVPSAQHFELGLYLDGAIGEIRLYDRPLGAIEIGALASGQ